MFKIIKSGRQELHYVDYTSKENNCATPPLLITSYTNNGAKRRFVKVNEEMFVKEIKKRPILYNTTLKDYKRFSTRHEAWAEVAVAMNLSEQECKKRWRSLRDAFMKVVRNKNEEERKTWIHYRLLEFLLPYIGNRMKKSKAVEFLEDFENDEETEFIELEEDIELYDGSREPITVSYVTEDGKEVFQMLQDPDTIPEGAVIGIEETEEEDEGEEEAEQGVIQDIHHPIEYDDQEIETPQEQHHSESILYEERLDTFETCEKPLIQEEVIKQEAHSEPDVDEIHVEEIEMDLLMSEDAEGEHNCPEPEPQSIVNMDPHFSEDSSFPEMKVSTVVQGTDTPTQSNVSSQTSPPVAQIQSHPALQDESKVLPTPAQESQDKYDGADADERFLLSCAPILRRLSSKKNQLARLKFQQLLYELEYDEKYNS
ncbi:histone acetyltransferase KAT6B-like [Toxorhynchites rutilus septentrionalis]|uniref:histone acetyltransferase KAT6B-like n=1 Tax=Toxorhynchites rutilus septentrionalis TaxID=329112 RepID=UPI0024794C5F|nr:histone acetyltransferase KAT6B-like [Toxorhynchites rutilus septentrionalis]